MGDEEIAKCQMWSSMLGGRDGAGYLVRACFSLRCANPSHKGQDRRVAKNPRQTSLRREEVGRRVVRG